MVEAVILREVCEESWIANPVMVKKSDGSWRLCIDFTDLNRACSKDSYRLPDMDEQIDSLTPFKFKCFLDAYKGYHQIQMAKEDKDKMAFHTDIGIFCYAKMPFGLKNARATYQWLMDEVCIDQRKKNLEVYVDDIVIKSKAEKVMLSDIAESFINLRKHGIKLNPAKCSFGVEEGKFLGVIITNNRIKVNSNKVSAILDMSSPRTLKDLQTLNGRLVAISHFLAKQAERSLPFLKVLKDCLSRNKLNWTAEAEDAFKAMKTFLAKLPILAAPFQGERLQMYLAAAEEAVSAVLMVERQGKQTLIYYVSRVLTAPEINYTILEKLVLALVYSSRRLRRYFQNHHVTILTTYPIQQILKRPDMSGRLAK